MGSAGIWKAFAKAVICGAIAAAALPTALIAMMLIASLLTNPVDLNDMIAAFVLLSLPFAIAMLVITVSGALIALPLTLALRRSQRETAFHYDFAGAVCGFAIPLLWQTIVPEGRPDLSLALLGSVGGAVTAHIWWKSTHRSR